MVPALPIEEVSTHPDFLPLAGIAGIRVDLRYASAANFVGHDLYSPFDCAWLHRDGAAALERSAAWLAAKSPGHALLVLDALRPQRVQEQLWAKLEGTGLEIYLAPPQRGSIHSFGMAVDVTIASPDGREFDMGTPFDDLTELSHPALEAGHLAAGRLTQEHVRNRELLRSAMLAGGWQGITREWWHFDAGGHRARVRETYPRVL